MYTEEDRRLIDNKLWTRGELKRLRGRIARVRDKRISDTLKQVHTPYHKRPIEDSIRDSGTILFDLT